MTAAEKPIKAYTVLEDFEYTGGIVFARHAVTARRIGANQYAEGDFSLVSCRRAQWADKYADTDTIPASEMVWHGWKFECFFCGRQIEGERRPYRKWTPDFVVGNGNGGAVYCDKACCTADKREREFAERLKARTVAHYAKRLGKRLPDITVKPIGVGAHRSHVYVDGGRIKQIVIDFDWPGQKIGPAAFRWDSRNPGSNGLTCCFGDKEAFEAFAAKARAITRTAA